LSTCEGGSGEDNGLSFTESIAQQIEDEFVIKDGIHVMHSHGIRTVVIFNAGMRNAFAWLRSATKFTKKVQKIYTEVGLIRTN
jgi:hypothetical protein